MSATAIRSLHPAYEQHHDRRGRVMVADHDGFARRLIQNALRKLGVHTRSDAVAAAERLRHEEALTIKILTPRR